MSNHKKRSYFIRGFDLNNEQFDKPTGVMTDKPSFTETRSNSLSEAIGIMMGLYPFNTMMLHTNNELKYATRRDIDIDFDILTDNKNILNEYNIKFTIGNLQDYTKDALIEVKNELFEMVKAWSEKSRVKKLRGWRVAIVSTPRFDYDKNTNILHMSVKVILSNTIIYSHIFDKHSDYEVKLSEIVTTIIEKDMKKLYNHIASYEHIIKLEFEHVGLDTNGVIIS